MVAFGNAFMFVEENNTGHDSSDLIRDAENKADVSVDSCNIYFYGYCRECRDAEAVSE